MFSVFFKQSLGHFGQGLLNIFKAKCRNIFGGFALVNQLFGKIFNSAEATITTFEGWFHPDFFCIFNPDLRYFRSSDPSSDAGGPVHYGDDHPVSADHFCGTGLYLLI